MTLIFDRRDTLPDGPQMHAIVLGVGRFPHVPTAPQADRKACPDSARAMVDFLEMHKDDFTASLATVECLISDPRVPPEQDTCPRTDHDPRDDEAVDSGLHDTVKTACRDWLDRCREDDVLFFYGASHGLATTAETALLVCEDYKSIPREKSHGLLSVDSIVRAAPAETKAGASWVFMDACQEISQDLLGLANGPSAIRPAELDVTQTSKSFQKSISVFSSVFGGKAYAHKAGGLAYFTEALIEGLSGCCVKLEGDEWYVSGKSLADRIEDILDILYDYPIRTSRLEGGSGRGYRLLKAQDPRAPVAVSTWPESKLKQAVSARIVTRDPPHAEVKTRNDTAPVWRCSVSLASKELKVEVMPNAGPKLVKSFTLGEEGVEVTLP